MQEILIQADDYDPALFVKVAVVDDPVGDVEQIMIFPGEIRSVFRGEDIVVISLGNRVIEILLIQMELAQPRILVSCRIERMGGDHPAAVGDHSDRADVILGIQKSIHIAAQLIGGHGFICAFVQALHPSDHIIVRIDLVHQVLIRIKKQIHVVINLLQVLLRQSPRILSDQADRIIGQKDTHKQQRNR